MSKTINPIRAEEVKVYYNVDESSLLRESMNLGSRIFLCPKSGKVVKKVGVLFSDVRSVMCSEVRRSVRIA